MVNAAVLLPLHKARRGIPAGLLKFTAVLLKFTAVLLKIHRGSVGNSPRFCWKFAAVLLAAGLLGFTAVLMMMVN